MFRVKFALGFVVLLSLLVLFSYTVLQSNVRPVVLEDTDIALQRSAALVEKSHRLDQYSLVEKARFVANRSNIRRGMIAEYDGDWESERHQEMHRLLETEKLRFEQQANRHAGARNLDLSLMHRRPSDQQLFMAIDDSGRGVAAVGRDLSQWMGDNVAADFPIVLQAMQDNQPVIDLWNWSWRATDDRQLYVVTIVPIRHPTEDETVGAFILGNLINDGIAEQSRSLVSDGLGSDGSESLSPRGRILSPEVAFFRGDRIYSSTLRSNTQNQLRQELFERHDILGSEELELEQILDVELRDQNYRGVVRLFSGQIDSDAPAGVVLLTNRDHAIAPVAQAQTNILFVGAGILFAGLLFIAFFFHFFLRPLERLEDGIQEIISGDKDYVFPADESHEVANGLAHHLNLLSAYLQGKPMPDDDQPTGGWGEELSGGGSKSASAETEESPKVAGVPMGLGSKEESEPSTEETT